VTLRSAATTAATRPPSRRQWWGPGGGGDGERCDAAAATLDSAMLPQGVGRRRAVTAAPCSPFARGRLTAGRAHSSLSSPSAPAGGGQFRAAAPLAPPSPHLSGCLQVLCMVLFSGAAQAACAATHRPIRRDRRALELRALHWGATADYNARSARRQAANAAAPTSVPPSYSRPVPSPSRAARDNGPAPYLRTLTVPPGYAHTRYSMVFRSTRAYSVAPDVPPPQRGAAPGLGPADPGRVCCAA
jgi:hypothetical protein